MKKYLVVTAIFISSVTTVWACKLGPDSSWNWSDEQLVEKTANIVEGKLIGEKTGKDGDETTEFEFSVIRKIKGTSGPIVVVKAVPSSNAKEASYTKSCQFSSKFQKNKHYLIFIGAFHPKATKEVGVGADSRAWVSKVEGLVAPKK